MIHGRFQPFHNGHLEYLIAAAARCETLLVGLANPDPLGAAEWFDPDSYRPESNPFTDAERVLMLDAVLADLDLRWRTRVVRFSIQPTAVSATDIPEGTVHFLRVFDAWERRQAERLVQAGVDAVVLHEGRPKTVSGSQVRALLRAGEGWDRRVPRAVARVLRSLPGSPGSVPTV